MIKYIELTAPEASAFRQAKIVSIECQEGDPVKQGDTLFMVQSGNQEIALPAKTDGRIAEIIAVKGENITISTALVLLETEVEGTSSKQTEEVAKESANQNTKQIKKDKTKKKTSKKKTSKKNSKKKNASRSKHRQQTLNLLLDDESNEAQNHIDSDSDNKPSKNEDTKPMSSDTIEIHVPDIGGDTAKVIEILVQLGDQVEPEQALLTLESDKASMDVPSTAAGVVASIDVELNDEIGEGTLIVSLTGTAESTDSTAAEPNATENKQTKGAEESSPKESSTPDQTSETQLTNMDISVPDIGGDAAKVIEILVKVGDTIDAEDSIITLESDKASMDVPSPVGGTIQSIEVSIDQDVSEGTHIATISQSGPAVDQSSSKNSAVQDSKADSTNEPSSSVKTQQVEQSKPPASQNTSTSQATSHASPSIRRFGRELGVDLSKVVGSGRKGRVLKEDVKAFVKGVMTSGGASAGTAGIPEVPTQDFSKFGEVDVQPLNKIKRLTATNLHRSWLNVPHVTHNDEANVTELEAFRKSINEDFKKNGAATKVSPLAFIVKALVRCLKDYPQFNSSLEAGGENLIYKKYFHIGIAVDTPNGLVVPVIKNADSKSVSQIADDMNELAKKARDKKLSISDMSGACITISSLGGIGGTSFTPIVNAPEVAILGVSRSKIAPVWNGENFEPGTMLPLSLSYDHRVIDGAEAARFTRHLAELLEDVRLLTI